MRPGTELHTVPRAGRAALALWPREKPTTLLALLRGHFVVVVDSALARRACRGPENTAGAGHRTLRRIQEAALALAFLYATLARRCCLILYGLGLYGILAIRTRALSEAQEALRSWPKSWLTQLAWQQALGYACPALSKSSERRQAAKSGQRL